MRDSRLPLPIVMLVTDRRAAGGADALVAKVAAAVEGGVNAVQLREKDLGQGELIEIGVRVKEAIAGRAALILNSNAQAALQLGADGVHFPEDVVFERPAEPILAGRSVHSVEAAKQAESDGADYLVFGPIYEKRGHPRVEPAGVRMLSQASSAVNIPVVAIGGIGVERVVDVIEAGASGVAVISALLDVDDARGAAAAIRQAFSGDRNWTPHDGIDPQR